MSLNDGFNIRRLENCLVAAWDFRGNTGYRMNESGLM